MIRAETSMELESLKPAFDPVSGRVTAGSSSAISDGASLVMTAESARLGVRKVKIKAMAGSFDPAIMGIGPVHAVKA